ncbi:MAG: hypothetical protein ACI30R_06055 [Sodaliphilus sp.]
MKKVLLMLAAVASLMMVSCGKGDGKAAGSDSSSDSTAAANAEVTYPVVLNCKLSSTSGDFKTLKPGLGVVKYTLNEPQGDMVPVEAEVTLKVAAPDPTIKKLVSYKVMLGYRDAADESKQTTYIDVDPAEGPKMVELITKGKEGDEGVFKFAGNIKKEEADALRAAKKFYMFNDNVVWER